MQPLTDFEKAILEFERAPSTHVGGKLQAIWQTFCVPPTRYFQFLSFIINKDAALAHDPLLVRRLRRIRDAGGDEERSASHETRDDREP